MAPQHKDLFLGPASINHPSQPNNFFWQLSRKGARSKMFTKCECCRCRGAHSSMGIPELQWRNGLAGSCLDIFLIQQMWQENVVWHWGSHLVYLRTKIRCCSCALEARLPTQTVAKPGVSAQCADNLVRQRPGLEVYSTGILLRHRPQTKEGATQLMIAIQILVKKCDLQ